MRRPSTPGSLPGAPPDRTHGAARCTPHRPPSRARDRAQPRSNIRSARAERPPIQPSMLAPLRLPAYRRIALTYLLNEVCWSLGTVALAILVFARTHSAMAVTALFLATTVAPALLAPALTAGCDGFAARRVVPTLYVVEAVVFAALVVAARRFALPLVLVLAFADSAIAIAPRALSRAALAEVLNPTGELDAGNRLLNVVFALGAAVGPALAGGVVAVAGVPGSLAATAALLAAMALVIATARTLPPARGQRDGSWRERLAEGVAYVRGRAPIRRVLGAHAAALSVAAAATPVEVVYAERSLHGGPDTYGLLLAVWGAGTVLSSVGLTRAGRIPAIALVLASAGAMGAGYLLMAAAPGVPVALAGCLLGGIGNGVYCVAVIQAVQERLADDVQARVMGLLESLTAACYGAGFVLGGALMAIGSPRLAPAVAGVAGLAAVAVTARLLRGARAPSRGLAPAGLRPAAAAGD